MLGRNRNIHSFASNINIRWIPSYVCSHFHPTFSMYYYHINVEVFQWRKCTTYTFDVTMYTIDSLTPMKS